MAGYRDKANECACDGCQRACQFSPGWFLPGEAEKVAKHLGTTLPQLFKEKLVVNWFEGEGKDIDIFNLAPGVVGNETGTMAEGDPTGTCVFFVEGKCSIHAVKPHECAMYNHADSRGKTDARHKRTALAWRKHQRQLTKLLGHKPFTRPYFGGLSSLLVSSFKFW